MLTNLKNIKFGLFNGLGRGIDLAIEASVGSEGSASSDCPDYQPFPPRNHNIAWGSNQQPVPCTVEEMVAL